MSPGLGEIKPLEQLTDMSSPEVMITGFYCITHLSQVYTLHLWYGREPQLWNLAFASLSTWVEVELKVHNLSRLRRSRRVKSCLFSRGRRITRKHQGACLGTVYCFMVCTNLLASLFLAGCYNADFLPFQHLFFHECFHTLSSLQTLVWAVGGCLWVGALHDRNLRQFVVGVNYSPAKSIWALYHGSSDVLEPAVGVFSIYGRKNMTLLPRF